MFVSPQLRGRRGAPAVLFAVLLLAASCSSGSGDSDVGFGDETPTSAADSTTSTDATDAPTTDTAADQTVTSSPDGDTTTSSAPSDTTTSSAPSDTTAVAQPDLPQDCFGIDAPLLPVQLTFTAENRLFGTGFDGSPECLLVLDPGSDVVAWGAQGDKVLLSDGRIETLGDPAGQSADGRVRDSAHFSRPTGFNIVWVAEGQINKSRVDGAGERVLDLGVPVTEVVYHPDGQHLLAVTSDPTFAGSSVWVTTNEGADGAPLLFSDDGVISALAISADGEQVVFVGTHDDGGTHIHRLDLPEVTVETPLDDGSESVERMLVPSEENAVETLFESASPLTDIVINGEGTFAAFAEGTCETGSSVEIIDLVAGGYALTALPNESARPVGFTTENELIVMTHPPDCGPGGDLWAVDLLTGDSTLVRAQVDSAAVRRIDPPAKYSLVDVLVTGFA